MHEVAPWNARVGAPMLVLRVANAVEEAALSAGATAVAEHVADAESFVVTEGHGRIVHEWRAKPSHPDNHWFDCLVGCAVAASVLGVSTGAELPRRRNERPLTTADLRRK